jgi:spore coat protein U-like protein
MNRQRLLFVAAVGCLAALLPAGAFAQSATANLSVTANVAANCTITTTPVAFGAYDPVVANDTAALDAVGTVRVACTKGASPTVGLGLGGNPSGSTRRMAGSTAGEYLTYELYHPGGHTTIWGTGGAGLFAAGAAPSRAVRTFDVNGRIAGGQDVGTGNYNDTVVATVNF